MKSIAFIAIVFFCNTLHAQIIKGKILLNDRPLEYASIAIATDKDSLIGSYLSGKDGDFQTIKYNGIDAYAISVSYVGTSGYRERFQPADLTKPLVIRLEAIRENIDTVAVTVDRNNTTLELNKRIYRFNPNDFIKNTTLDIAINKVPGVVFAEGLGLKLDGSPSVRLYVDGIATNLTQLKGMDVSAVERTEIVDNPSAKFGAESNFAIINIITKRRPEAFYKGRVGLSKGLLMGSTGGDPSFSFKQGKWLVKTGAFYSKYEQKTSTDVVRNSRGTSYFRSDERETDIAQLDANVNLLYDIDTTSSLFVRSNYYGHRLSGNTSGKIDNAAYTNLSRDSYWIYAADGVYDKKLKTAALSIKGKYNTYRNSVSYAIDHSGHSANTVRSGLSDVFVEASYTHGPKWFASTEHDFGAKYVDRSFLFTRGERFKQRNIGLYSDWSIRLNEKINVSPALYLDVSNNDVNGRMTRYASFLPSANLSVKSGKTGRVSASYSRRIHRPSPVDLNGEVVVLDPTTFQRGNPDLKQSASNRFQLAYANPYGKNFLSATFFYSSSDNAIFQDVENNRDTLTLTKGNIGNIQRVRATIGHNLTAAPGVSLYTSVGMHYNHLEKGGNERLFHSGYGLFGTVNLSARLLKKLTTSLLLDYDPRKYDLYSKIEERPFTSFVLSTNVLKDKVNLRLSYLDLFKIYAKREVHLSSPNFAQSTYQNRNLSNINLSIAYSFGKTFSDRISTSTTSYDDIELR